MKGRGGVGTVPELASRLSLRPRGLGTAGWGLGSLCSQERLRFCVIEIERRCPGCPARPVFGRSSSSQRPPPPRPNLSFPLCPSLLALWPLQCREGPGSCRLPAQGRPHPRHLPLFSPRGLSPGSASAKPAREACRAAGGPLAFLLARGCGARPALDRGLSGEGGSGPRARDERLAILPPVRCPPPGAPAPPR